MASERDDILFFSEPSFYADSTPEMRKAGAKILLKEIAEMELQLGIYVAQGIVAEIYAEMSAIKARSSQ
jgi:hypothetical protein